MTMTDPAPNKPAARVLTIAVVGLMIAFAAIIAAKEFNLVDQAFARRGVSALLGLLLAVCGNYLPKLTRQPDADTALLGRADRAAGRVLILTGLAFSVIWLAAPLGTATAIASIVGLLGASACIAVWAWIARRAEGGSARMAITATDTAVRAAVAMIVLSIFVTFGIFEIDRIWGDQAAQWSAIIFSLMIAFGGGAPVFTTLFRRG
jgi:ABC-type Fe3+-siderophore transport system permease subunit